MSCTLGPEYVRHRTFMTAPVSNIIFIFEKQSVPKNIFIEEKLVAIEGHFETKKNLLLLFESRLFFFY